MRLRERIGATLRAAAALPVIGRLLDSHWARRWLAAVPGFAQLYSQGWALTHPFDRTYGVRTSGMFKTTGSVYAASQPSIIRTVLRGLPELKSYAFVDLGCGKGRPLFVASEFPFRALIGVELTPALVRIARHNAARLLRRFPERIEPHIVVCDAGSYFPPPGNLVIFLYNSFPEQVVRRCIDQLLLALKKDGDRTVFIVCYNPVCGWCFDASDSFARYYAANLPYSPQEQGYGPDTEDAVVVWQAGNIRFPPMLNAEASIRVVRPGERALLEL